MLKKRVKFFSLVSILLLGTFSTSACAHKKDKKIPSKSFAKVYKIINVKKCKEESKNCQVSNIGTSGSALAVFKFNEKILFLSASHVCDSNIPEVIMRESEDVEVKFLVQLYDSHWHLAKIVKTTDIQETGLDLCLLEVKLQDPKIKAVPISRTPPEVGDQIYSIGSPVGIYHPPSVPIFSGIYSGPIYRGNVSLTTIPAIGGSSGSAVLNQNLEVIGVLFATHPEFPFVSIITNQRETRKFVYDYILSVAKKKR
jgi:S1-C subfamily serine protease